MNGGVIAKRSRMDTNRFAAVFLMLVLCTCASCQNRSGVMTSVEESTIHSKASETSTLIQTPHFPQVVVSINNTRFGEDNGCSSTIDAMQTKTNRAMKMKCGHPGFVSSVSLAYVRSDRAGDYYLVTRSFPLGKPNESTTEATVCFTGIDLTVFEDDVQRVSILPPKSTTLVSKRR